MSTKQQQESLEYFRQHADDWRTKAESAHNLKVNVIEQRNGFVQLVAEEIPQLRSFLDVGCGTGELVCNIARLGINATGVDYAAEMIELASRKAKSEGLQTAHFLTQSIFDLEIEPESYGLVSANGFIEYVSPQQLEQFIEIVKKALVPGGSFVVGSRNRLFNLVSMNELTLQELETGHVDSLIKEAVQWTKGVNLNDELDRECGPTQSIDIVHEKRFIDVSTRFQYTPLQLMRLLAERELTTVEIYPVHVHGVPPSFKETNREVHVSIARVLQTFARHNTQLLTNASSFMLHAKKAE